MKTLFQFARYSTVGLASNLLLYLTYLVITYIGLGHKTAMSILYLCGVAMTFLFNRNWTFRHEGTVSLAFWKYILVYFCGYIFNWVVLYSLVDIAGWPHQLVQGVMILALATAIFMAQKFWVFKK